MMPAPPEPGVPVGRPQPHLKSFLLACSEFLKALLLAIIATVIAIIITGRDR